MPDTQQTHNKVLKMITTDSQNTHDVAAQATAGRLLPLLEERYAYLGKGEPAKETQNVLLAYIDQVTTIKNTEPMPEMIYSGGQPHPVAQLIEIMLSLDYDPLSKKTLLLRLRKFAANYPGDEWSNEDAQWCFNAVYNAEQDKIVLISSSPSKTLSLVCAAILAGQHHYRPETQTNSLPVCSSSVQVVSAEDERLRVRELAAKLADYLLKLQVQVINGQFDKCSGGRQHELLWLLEGSYLDAENKPFEFIQSLPGFLLALATEFIQDQLLPQAKHEERVSFTTDWIAFSIGKEPAINPLQALLASYYGDSWLEKCNAWMAQRCAHAGISPTVNARKIDAIANCLLELGSPITDNAQAQLILTLCRENPVTRCTPEIQALVQARNTALQRFKTVVGSGNWDALKKYQDCIADLHTAEHWFQSMLRYSNMILIGDEDGGIKDASLPMMAALLDFFSRYELDARLPQEFDLIKATYREKEERFRQQSHIDAITPFFQAMKEATHTEFEAYWARIQVIPGLQLSDERIENMLNEHLVEAHITIEKSANTLRTILTRVTELSTYDINRLLLHGLHVAPRLWSNTYKQTLSALCLWLLSPKSEEDSLELAAVKQGYPEYLLGNLLLETLLLNDESMQDLLRSRQPNAFYFLSQNLLMLRYHFISSDLTAASRYIQLISPYFGMLIQEGCQLFHLLNIDKLTEEERKHVWEAAKDRLPEIIRGWMQLWFLFNLKTERFSEIMGTHVLEALKDKMPELAENIDNIVDLFKCPLQRFTTAQRTLVLEAFKDKLASMITDWNAFKLLFDLNYECFNVDQRTMVLEAIKDNLPSIITNGSQLWFLIETCNTEQCTLIFDAVKDNWSAMISNLMLLVNLFKLYPVNLNSEQYNQIWNAIQHKMHTMILNPSHLKEILVLNSTQFNHTQRQRVFTKLKENGWSEEILIEAYGRYSPVTPIHLLVAPQCFFQSAAESSDSYLPPSPKYP